MESRLGIRVLIVVAFTAALLAYHATNELFPQNAQHNLFLLFKIAQIVALTVVTFAFVTNEWVVKVMVLILGARYIGGAYVGNSYKGDTPYPLNLKIKQSLFGAHLEAQSKAQDGRLVSNWTGTLFKNEGNKFYFGISLDGKGLIESGVLDVAFNERGLDGYYRPAHHKSEEAYRVTVKRK